MRRHRPERGCAAAKTPRGARGADSSHDHDTPLRHTEFRDGRNRHPGADRPGRCGDAGVARVPGHRNRHGPGRRRTGDSGARRRSRLYAGDDDAVCDRPGRPAGAGGGRPRALHPQSDFRNIAGGVLHRDWPRPLGGQGAGDGRDAGRQPAQEGRHDSAVHADDRGGSTVHGGRPRRTCDGGDVHLHPLSGARVLSAGREAFSAGAAGTRERRVTCGCAAAQRHARSGVRHAAGPQRLRQRQGRGPGPMAIRDGLRRGNRTGRIRVFDTHRAERRSSSTIRWPQPSSAGTAASPKSGAATGGPPPKWSRLCNASAQRARRPTEFGNARNISHYCELLRSRTPTTSELASLLEHDGRTVSCTH